MRVLFIALTFLAIAAGLVWLGGTCSAQTPPQSAQAEQYAAEDAAMELMSRAARGKCTLVTIEGFSRNICDLKTAIEIGRFEVDKARARVKAAQPATVEVTEVRF